MPTRLRSARSGRPALARVGPRRCTRLDASARGPFCQLYSYPILQAIAAAELVACEIVGDPSCTNRVQGWWQMCLSGAATLPPPIPTPPPEASPTPPSCGGPVLEAAPPTGPQARAAHPENGRPECAGSNGTNVSIMLIDPVPDLLNQAGDAIVSDWKTLAGGQTVVHGVATDGAARLVIRISGGFAGQQFTLSVVNDGVQPSSGLPQPLGTIAQTDGSHAGSQITVTARHVWSNGVDLGVMAFAQYFPPPDFSRGGNDDNIASRIVQLQVTSPDGSFTPVSANITLWRPPLVFVHGLWGSPDDWNTFGRPINDSRFPILERANYSRNLYYLSGTNPTYNPPILLTGGDALGFLLNSLAVEYYVSDGLNLFRKNNHAAVTQVDVIAHSMGGVITRTLEDLPDYASKTSFNAGTIHKLITIGTPHLGSPLAIDLLTSDPPGASNACLRAILAKNGKYAFESVTLDQPGDAQIPGGVGDLQGDVNGGSLSNALSSLATTHNPQEAPTALIAATMNDVNTRGVRQYWRRFWPQVAQAACR